MNLIGLCFLTAFLLTAMLIIRFFYPPRVKNPDCEIKYYYRYAPLHVPPNKIPRSLRWRETHAGDPRGIAMDAEQRQKLGLD